MNKHYAWLMLWALTATRVYAEGDSACATASLTNPTVNEGGIGGTGLPANNDGGIGGTGAPIAAGGIGGTGAAVVGGGTGGTGDALQIGILPSQADGDVVVMGAVTGFASICVGNVEVHYNNQTAVYDNGMPAKQADLAVGKTVMLKAVRVDGRLHAKAVGMFDAVAGPIDHATMPRGQIRVLGQTVHLPAQDAQQIAQFKPDAMVRVSGTRLADGSVAATRVDMGAAGASANTFGLVSTVDNNGFVINNTRVTVTNKAQLAGLSVGSEVRVSGTAQAGSIAAQHIEQQPIGQALKQSHTFIAEGIVSKQKNGQLSIAGTQFKGYAAMQQSALEQLNGKVVKIEAYRNREGQWVAETIESRKGRLYDRETLPKGVSNDDGDSKKASSNREEANSSGHDSSGSGAQHHAESGHGASAGHGSASDRTSSGSNHGGSASGSSHGSSGGGSGVSSSQRSSGSGSSGSGSSHGGGKSSSSGGRNKSDRIRNN